MNFKIALPVIVSLFVVGNTFAFFSDNAQSTGNILTAAASFCQPTQEQGPFYASVNVSQDQGLRKNGTTVLATRSIPSSVLGAPDATTNPDAGFYSLGYGGVMVVSFAHPVVNVDGVDLSFHEITGGRSTYPIEEAKVEVSQNGIDWFLLSPEITSEPAGDGITFLDISSNGAAPTNINYVKITDTTNESSNPDANSDAFDIDAIDATSLCLTSQSPSTSPTPISTPSPISNETLESTPSASPSVAPENTANHLVISEVQTTEGTGKTNHDFIEIYNPTNLTQDLNGMRLVKRSGAALTDTSIKSWTNSTDIPAHSFYLWASSGDTSFPGSIGADTSTSSTITDDNSIALRNGLENTGTVIDEVGWGTGTALAETNPFVTNPTANQSVERKAYLASTTSTMIGVDATKGNGFDTNNNSLDFILRATSGPQNSLSATETP